jgi:type IV pilus assembly protein PilA
MIRNIRRNIRKSRGFTLVELMIVVAIVGILAALAIYGVTKYMKSAKTAEARNSLGQLTKDASAAFNREKMAGTLITPGEATSVSNKLCATAANTVPPAADKAKIAGSKYQSKVSEWNEGDASTGWQCLRFSMSEPQYFMYGYTAVLAGDAEGDTFAATAQGDLDGDGTLSEFKMEGKVDQGAVIVTPTIAESSPDE